MTALTMRCRIATMLRVMAPMVSVCCILLSKPACAQQRSRKGKPPAAVPGPARKGRAVIVIDGTWQFAKDIEKHGIDAGWPKRAPSVATDTSIPALWTSSAAPGYSGSAWYWRTFAIPSDWKGQTVRILLNAAAENASVWLNGEALGDHAGGATPFEFNVTKTAKIGQDNLLAIKVDGDGMRGAGIWQGVEVISHDEAYIQQMFASADAFGGVSADISLLNTSAIEGDATLDCVVAAMTGKTHMVDKSNQNLHLTPNLNVTNFITSVKRKDLTLWSLENPFIYAFQLIFHQDKDILDTDEVKFGFRSFGFQNNQITINGAPLMLSAIAPHLALPVVIATTDDTDKARDLLTKAKAAGVTLIYLDAANPAMLDLADTTGILIVEGARPGLVAAARDAEMRALVLRDRNHPSILGWSAGDCGADFARDLRQQDPSRFLVTGAGKQLQLWAPGKAAPERGDLPAGLLPVNR